MRFVAGAKLRHFATFAGLGLVLAPILWLSGPKAIAEQRQGQLVRLLHADAAVAGRIAGVGTGMERDALFIVHLHEGHGSIVVLAAVALHFLQPDLPEAELGPLS
mgnify:CR=1 FL=1